VAEPVRRSISDHDAQTVGQFRSGKSRSRYAGPCGNSAANRLKLAPLKEDDLHTLVELGFVEMQDGGPVVTASELAALE